MSEFIPFPQKEYNIIYADPPWRYADKGCNGNAADHYATMSFAEMCRLPVIGAGGGIGYRSKRLCADYVGNLPHDAGGAFPYRCLGLHLQEHCLSVGEAEPQRQRLLFRFGALDTRQHRTMLDCHQRQATEGEQFREPAGGITLAAALAQARRGAGSHRRFAGGRAAHRAVCARNRTRLGLLGQRGSNDRRRTL